MAREGDMTADMEERVGSDEAMAISTMVGCGPHGVIGGPSRYGQK